MVCRQHGSEHAALELVGARVGVGVGVGVGVRVRVTVTVTVYGYGYGNGYGYGYPNPTPTPSPALALTLALPLTDLRAGTAELEGGAQRVVAREHAGHVRGGDLGRIGVRV